jgi:hypothetical protein
MIAAGDEVDAGLEHLLSGLRGQPKTARGVLTVGDAGADVMLFAGQRDAAFERLTPGRADDVSDEQKVEGAGCYRRADAFAFF